MITYKSMANFANDEKDLKTFILDDLKVRQPSSVNVLLPQSLTVSWPLFADLPADTSIQSCIPCNVVKFSC